MYLILLYCSISHTYIQLVALPYPTLPYPKQRLARFHKRSWAGRCTPGCGRHTHCQCDPPSAKTCDLWDEEYIHIYIHTYNEEWSKLSIYMCMYSKYINWNYTHTYTITYIRMYIRAFTIHTHTYIHTWICISLYTQYIRRYIFL